MITKCKTCQLPFENYGDSWKKQCLECYRSFKGLDRIRKLGYHHNDVYMTHPNVMAEEVNAMIKAKGWEHGWGATLWTPENFGKFKIFVNYTNYD